MAALTTTAIVGTTLLAAGATAAGAATTGLFAAAVLGGAATLAAKNKIQNYADDKKAKANQQNGGILSTSLDPMPKMPTIDTKKITQNRARQFANLQRRSGRQSTLLTTTPFGTNLNGSNQSNTLG